MNKPLKIRKISIIKLFDRFEYNISLDNEEDNIYILTAPNGYGKSTILRIINSLSSGDLFYFAREKYETIKIYFSNDSILQIAVELDNNLNRVVKFSMDDKVFKLRDPFTNNELDEKTYAIERAMPFLRRVGPRKWRDERSGEILDKTDILFRFGDHPIFRKLTRKEEWIDNLIDRLQVFSISTNRLKQDYESDYKEPSINKPNLMVGSIAYDIRERIQEAIRNQFEIGRKKETSFPTRLIESLKSELQPSKDSIMESLRKVQEFEERYSRLGLLPGSGNTQELNVHAESTENAGLLVLKTYLDDIIEKFLRLEKLANHLDTFCTSINKLFSFKYIETSANDGITVKGYSPSNEILNLSFLSSGEQHLIVMIGKLIFNTEAEALVLIDEPEISFHPEWQEKFINILIDIIKLKKFSVLIATHSPILIGNRWDKVIELAEQYKERAGEERK